MRITVDQNRVLDASSLVGILAGIGLLLPSLFLPELRALVIPALVLFMLSLLCCMR